MSKTIDDIAKACGLSRATVSRVLTGNPHVSEKSRRIVEQVIRETGYQPNRVAQSLAQGYSNTVALLIGNISSVAQIEIAKTIQRELYEQQFMVWLCNSDYDTDLCDAYLDTSIANRLAGAILVTTAASSGKMQQTVDSGLPLVLINRQEMLVPCDSVLGNDQKAAHQAVTYLYRRGHRSIALLTSTHKHIPSRQAYLGYQAALAECGIPFREELVYQFDIRTYSDTFSPRFVFDASTLFTQTPEASAIICSSDEVAVEFYAQCRKIKKGIPRDISLISLDPVRRTPVQDINFCTFGADQQALGKAAVRQMLERIQDRKRGNSGEAPAPSSTIILEPAFSEGNSVRSIGH